MSNVKYCVMTQEVFSARKWQTEDLYLDDQVYSVVVSPVSRKGNAAQYHLALLKDGKVITYGEWNKTMRANTRAAYLDKLTNSLSEILEMKSNRGDEFTIGINFGIVGEKPQEVNLEELPLRIVLFCKDCYALDAQEEERLRVQIKIEFFDWLEQVFHDVVKEAPLTAEEKHYQVMIGASMMPHEKPENNLDVPMTILSIGCLIASIFLREWFIPQIMAIFVAGCTAFRSAQHKNYVCTGICLAVALAGVGVSIWAYQEMKEALKGASEQLQAQLQNRNQ